MALLKGKLTARPIAKNSYDRTNGEYVNQHAFAALTSEGRVITWGDSNWGGDSSSVSSELQEGISQIFSTRTAFAALTSEGRVITWGDSNWGGDSSSVSSELQDGGISQIFSTGGAFAALTSDGRVITWGDSGRGGDSSSVSSELQEGISQIFSNGDDAFAALTSDGRVITWGSSLYGGDSSSVADQLVNVVSFANPFTDDRLVFAESTSLIPHPSSLEPGRPVLYDINQDDVDLNNPSSWPYYGSSSPRDFVAVGSTVYFKAAESPATGRALYRYSIEDGLNKVLQADITTIYSFEEGGGSGLLFSYRADHPIHGSSSYSYEIWKADEAFETLSRISPYYGELPRSELAASVGGDLYFVAGFQILDTYVDSFSGEDTPYLRYLDPAIYRYDGSSIVPFVSSLPGYSASALVEAGGNLYLADSTAIYKFFIGEGGGQSNPVSIQVPEGEQFSSIKPFEFKDSLYYYTYSSGKGLAGTSLWRVSSGNSQAELVLSGLSDSAGMATDGETLVFLIPEVSYDESTYGNYTGNTFVKWSENGTSFVSGPSLASFWHNGDLRSSTEGSTSLAIYNGDLIFNGYDRSAEAVDSIGAELYG